MLGKRPSIGVGTLVLNWDREEILLYKRISSKKWGFPGGHLERFESEIECSAWEMHEECGLLTDPSRHKVVAYINLFDKERGYHYFDIATFVEISDEEAKEIYNKADDEHTKMKLVHWNDYINMADTKSKPLFPTQYKLL